MQTREDGISFDQIVLSAGDLPEFVARRPEERQYDSAAAEATTAFAG